MEETLTQELLKKEYRRMRIKYHLNQALKLFIRLLMFMINTLLRVAAFIINSILGLVESLILFVTGLLVLALIIQGIWTGDFSEMWNCLFLGGGVALFLFGLIVVVSTVSQLFNLWYVSSKES